MKASGWATRPVNLESTSATKVQYTKATGRTTSSTAMESKSGPTAVDTRESL